MQRDDRSGLFKPSFEFVPDSRGVGPIEWANRITGKGLIRLSRRQFVWCVNPLDRDSKYVRDTECDGRIFISSSRNELNDDYSCPSCGRLVRPSKKRVSEIALVEPIVEGIRAFIEGLAASIDASAREAPLGVWRVTGRAREAKLCWVDECVDPACFEPGATPVVYVIGNDVDLSNRVPDGSVAFRIADLAVDGSERFGAHVRSAIDTGAEPPRTRRTNGPPWSASSAESTPVLAEAGLTRWEDVTIYLSDDENAVSVRIAGSRPKVMTFVDLGFKNERTGKSNKAWTVLRALCTSKGHVPVTPQSDQFESIKRQATEIRKALQELFRTEANPLQCTAENGLVAYFNAEPRPPGRDEYLADDVNELEAAARDGLRGVNRDDDERW